MTIAYLVDTDWALHHLHGYPVITQRLQDLQHEGLGLSVAALAEIYEGVYYSRDPNASERSLLTFLESVLLIGIDEETAKIFGRERGRLRASGMLIGVWTCSLRRQPYSMARRSSPTTVTTLNGFPGYTLSRRQWTSGSNRWC
jgi:predicted nucleic acid-binding protein